MTLVPELIPEAPGALEGLALLGALAAVVVVLGLVYVIDGFVRALFGGIAKLTGHIPLIGGLTKDVIVSTEQSITHALGTAEAKLDSYVAATWHKLARTVDKLGHEMFKLAVLGWTLAKVLGGFATVADYTRLWKQFKAQLATLEHLAGTAIRNVVPTWLPGVKQLEHWVRAQIRTLVHAAEHAIPYDIRTLRARNRSIEHELDRLWKAVRKLDKVIVTTAFVGAVAVALNRLGLKWLRCRSLSNIGNRLGCGGFALVEDLLAASLTAFAVLDICDFANAAETVAEAFVPELMALVDVENALVGCHGATAVPLLTLPTLHLPPRNLGLPLAA